MNNRRYCRGYNTSYNHAITPALEWDGMGMASKGEIEELRRKREVTGDSRFSLTGYVTDIPIAAVRAVRVLETAVGIGHRSASHQSREACGARSGEGRKRLPLQRQGLKSATRCRFGGLDATPEQETRP